MIPEKIKDLLKKKKDLIVKLFGEDTYEKAVNGELNAIYTKTLALDPEMLKRTRELKI